MGGTKELAEYIAGPPFLAEGGGPRFAARRAGKDDILKIGGIEATGKSGMLPVEERLESV